MRKLFFLCLLGSLLSACSSFHVHHVEVEQGNIMTSAMVNRLHAGMTENQVKAIMGEPILISIMKSSRESYVYTSQIGSDTRYEKKVTLNFNHGILQSIQRAGV